MPIWTRVRDDSTGHEYDALTVWPGMTPIEGYPPNAGPGAIPRPPKHFKAKDGTPARPRPRTKPPVDNAAAAAPTPEEEGQR
jgi:hypothetical protein